jgi:hypothetical protein
MPAKSTATIAGGPGRSPRRAIAARTIASITSNVIPIGIVNHSGLPVDGG